VTANILIVVIRWMAPKISSTVVAITVNIAYVHEECRFSGVVTHLREGCLYQRDGDSVGSW
jgi:hypothetical protein